MRRTQRGPSSSSLLVPPNLSPFAQPLSLTLDKYDKHLSLLVVFPHANNYQVNPIHTHTHNFMLASVISSPREYSNLDGVSRLGFLSFPSCSRADMKTRVSGEQVASLSPLLLPRSDSFSLNLPAEDSEPHQEGMMERGMAQMLSDFRSWRVLQRVLSYSKLNFSTRTLWILQRHPALFGRALSPSFPCQTQCLPAVVGHWPFPQS